MIGKGINRRLRLFVWFPLVAMLAGCSNSSTVDSERHQPISSDRQVETETNEPLVRRLVAAEELILRLTPKLKQLERSVKNLAIPDYHSESLFANQIQVTALNGLSPWQKAPLGVSLRSGDSCGDARATSSTAGVCPALFEGIVGFEAAKFSLVSGEFVSGTDAYTHFETPVKFSGKARKSDGRIVAVSLDLRLTWKRAGEQWLITGWQNRRLEQSTRAAPMFVDVRESVIREKATLAATRTSKHSEFALRHYYPRIRARLPGNYSDDRFFAISTAHHPGLAVVDIDQDGWDDLYITVRWGRNLLLRNGGDGTFTNVAADYGLDIEGRSTAAVFGDFDNDGDADAVVARSLDRSLYLENVDGVFTSRPNASRFPLPYAATSVSAVDYNNDGLLDVYFSTYHQEDVSQRIDADLAHPDHRIHKTLTPEHSVELAKRFRAESRSYINQIGPPNILLVNRGDGFELAPENDQVAVWRNSFHSTWCDYDRDGDADVYIANDFAPDLLLRNDGKEGFADVTIESGLAPIGFGMGASWGDYNGDGWFDLYVSNMFSKAGKRITSRVGNEAKLDSRIADLARGNYLHRTIGGASFELASDSDAASVVARAGWSWGGQFADYDNDGNLDIYVASGYYSVPSEYETDVDL